MRPPEEEFETRLRVSLEPTLEAVERVKAAALQVEPRRRVHPAPYAIAGVLAVLVLVAALSVWRRDPHVVQARVFTAEFSGDLLVIRASDGSVTLLGPPGAAHSPAGAFQITYEGGSK